MNLERDYNVPTKLRQDLASAIRRRGRAVLTRFLWNTKIVTMRNVTITLDEEVAKWARVWAAEHDTSVSRMVGELVREKMQHEDAYLKAYAEWKATRHIKWNISDGKPLPKREEIYTRGSRVRR